MKNEQATATKPMSRNSLSLVMAVLFYAAALVPTSAQVFGPPEALNHYATFDSKLPGDNVAQVRTDGIGNWVAVWQSTESLPPPGSSRKIHTARSIDGGASWSVTIPLHSSFASNNDRPWLTTDGAGNWVAVWESEDPLDGTIGSDFDILVARSTDAGATWSAPMAVNTNAATDAGYDSSAHLTTDGAGNWVAAWHSDDTLGGTLGADDDILVARSTDGGLTWTAPVPLNANAATDTGDDGSVQVTTDGAGNWAAVWVSDDTLGGTLGTDSDILVARSTDTGATWSTPMALDSGAASDSWNDSQAQIATDGAGNWITVWTGNFYVTLVARSTDAGLTWSSPTALGPGTVWYRGPQVTADGAGHWAVVWPSDDTLGGTIGTDDDILVAHSSDGGATWTDPEALNSNADVDSESDFAPQLAADGINNWVAVWTSQDSLGGTVGTDYDILVATAAGPDSDGDGVSDGAELNVYGTDPSLVDTDGDGFGDGAEVGAGSDPDDADSTPPDPFEQDDSCVGSTAAIRDGDVQSRNFEDDAEDWVAFNACAGRSYTFETLNLDATADTVLELYDGDCATLLASDDNSGTVFGSLLNWNAPADGTYHVKVRQADASSGSDREYDLSLNGDTSTCSTWAFDFGGPEDYEVRSSVATPDGGFLAFGRARPSGMDSSAWAVKVDPDGVVEWERTYSGTNSYFDDVRLSSAGTYLIAGSSGEKAWVLELDASGSVLRSNEYGPATGIGSVGAWVSDTEVITIGWHDQSGPDEALWVVHADPDGNISSQFEYAFAEALMVLEFCEALSDGGALLRGVLEFSGEFLIRLNSGGGVVWAKSFDVGVGCGRQTDDGGFIVTNDASYSFLPAPSALLVKLDGSGAVTWAKQYDSPIDEEFGAVALASDGGYVISGNRSEQDPQNALLSLYSDLWFVRVDSSGYIVWQRSFQGYPYVRAAVSDELPDGGFFLTGSTLEANPVALYSDDAHLRRVAADGTGCDGTTTSAVATPSSVSTSDLTVEIVATGESATGFNPTPGSFSPVRTEVCGFVCLDGDVDGFGLPGNFECPGGSSVDCDDGDGTVYPGAPEVCGDGLSNDCDEPSWPDPNAVGENDGDLDGSPACADCNDAQPDIYPDAPETNDGLDNQCAGDAGFGLIDELSGDPTFTDPNTFCWPAQAGATLYEIARSTDPEHSSACDFSQESGTCHTDTDVPPSGEVYYYLVRALAPNTGSWGENASGQERFPQCGLATYQFTDTSGDDVAQDSLFNFFQGLTPATTDFIYVEMSGSGQTRRFCATRADWYRDSYLDLAFDGGTLYSGGWDFWHTVDGTSWTYDPAIRENNYGWDCGETLSWCAEEDPSMRISVRPGRFDACEASEYGLSGIPITCSPIDTMIINVGSDRLLTCGF